MTTKQLDNAARLQRQADADKERALESLLFSNLHGVDEIPHPTPDPHPTTWIDRGGVSNPPTTPHTPHKHATSKKRKPAWADPDDAAVTIPIAAIPRLRKLRTTHEETTVDGNEYEQRLRKQHAKIYTRTAWARLDRGTIHDDDDDHPDGIPHDPDASLDGLEPSSQALVRRAGGLVAHTATLPQGLLEVSRLKDANAAAPSEGVVRAARFHPEGRLLMTAGLDKRLRFFKVDGVKNPLVESLFLEDLPIHTAHWGGDGQYVVASGRRKYFYVFDLAAQRCERVQGCFGAVERSYESFVVGGDAQRPCAAFLGDAGNVHLVSLTSRQSIATLTHSGSVRSATFSQDGTTLYTAGSDGVLYAWDLRTRRCLARGVDEGCLNSSALAASPLGDVLATASSSGVVNMYDTADLSWGVPKTTAAAHTTSALPPVSKPTRRPTTTVIHPAPRLQPTKTLMHLTTTIDTLTFSPSGEMMAFGSRMERDALKVLHVPSKTVFSNWPTTRSPLGYVHCVGFSPGGGLMAVGNAKGRVLLYRVHHYAEA